MKKTTALPQSCAHYVGVWQMPNGAVELGRRNSCRCDVPTTHKTEGAYRLAVLKICTTVEVVQ